MENRKSSFGLATLLASIASVSVGQGHQGMHGTTVPLQATQLQGIQLNPGERIVAIDGVPVAGAVQPPRTQPATRTVPRQPVQPMANGDVSPNIVGTLTPSNLPFSHTPGNTALEKANAERQRNGQGPLMPDPQLQALALQKANMAARGSYKNHVGGSLGSAKCEGVGWTNGRFLTCCLGEPGTYGGAAMVQGRDGWYCCLLVR